MSHTRASAAAIVRGSEAYGSRVFSLDVAEAGNVALTIVFFASFAAERPTGQAISVNGGISAA